MSAHAREQLELAERVHAAGIALVVHVSARRRTGPAFTSTEGEQVARALDKPWRKELKDALGDSYAIDAVEASDGSIEWRVAANEEYARRRTFGRLHASWTETVDHAVETLRRMVVERVSGDGTRVEAHWEPGRGVVPSDVAAGPDAPERALRARADDLRRRESGLSTRRLMAFVGAAVIGGVAIAAMLTSDDDFTQMMAAYGGLYALLGVLMGLRFGGELTGVRAESREVAEQLDLRDLLNEDERRAQRLFQLHSLQLKRYYDQALRQRGYIFFVGVACIAGGFAVVGITLAIVTRGRTDLDQQIVVAVVGSVGTILANFVAVVFLRMFTQTVRSMGDFHTRLVRTNLVHFGNVLVARISDSRMRDETLAAIARGVAQSAESADPVAAARDASGSTQDGAAAAAAPSQG